MRKEVTYAIIGGVALGLIIAFGVWRINSTITGNKKNNIDLSTPTPKPNTLGEFKVVLDKPENDDVVTQDNISVSGLTKPLTWVTLSGEDSDYTIQSDTSGVFSENVKLIPGVNQIKITAFETNGGKTATEVLVVYSSNFQTRTAIDSSKKEASGTSDIRQKVAEEVASVVNRPKAYIGTVTDITDSTLEIKTMASEIRQISVNHESTSVTNSTGTTSKQVKTTDIAIGDFVVAMGYINGNSVLNAQRILITNPISESKITVSQAKIASTTKKTLTVKTVSGGSEETVQPGAKTVIETIRGEKTTSAKFTDLATDDLVIYVVSGGEKDKTSVRSIFQIKSSQS